MKSSTIRRSNLSKEKIAVLEALSKFNNSNDDKNRAINDSGINSEPMDDGSPEVYVRQNKEKELDLLWKDFKMPKGERSPIVYLGIGFVSGIIATLAVSAFIGMSSGNMPSADNSATQAEVSVPADSSAANVAESDATATETSSENTSKKFSLFGSKNSETSSSSENVTTSNQEYEVQSGDTMEKIVKTFYGTYSEEKVNAIMKANNMSNPNKLAIGQKLVIPGANVQTAE